MQLEIRTERQKSWQNGNDVLWAAGTHWYWNEAGRWGPESSGRAALFRSVGGSLASCDPMLQSTHTDQQRLAFLHSICFDHSWTTLCPSVETRRRNVSKVCFKSVRTLRNLRPTIMDMWRACLIYQNFNFVTGLITMLVHLSNVFHYSNLCLAWGGKYLCCLELVNFVIVQKIHPDWRVCYLAVVIAASGSPGFSPRSWITISQEL